MRVAADRIRSLSRVTFEPGPAVTVVIGPNGTGKTNLLEAIYFGLTTRSFRTSDRRDLIPFDSTWARCRVDLEPEDGSGPTHSFMTAIDRQEGTRHSLDGAAVDRSEALRYRPAVTVFSPDRLELIKGPPALRRRHLDSFIATQRPHLAGVRNEFGRALAQRNALLSRLREGTGDRGQLGAWTARVAETGAALTRTRLEAIESLRDPWQRAATELGLEGAISLDYRPGGPVPAGELREALEGRIESDVRSGRTGVGPHHDEIRLEYRGRQLRRFGSQGQQRIGLLALLFAEREVLLASDRPIPLMLLDDVLSELDAERRGRLAERLLMGGQSIITAAEGELVPDRDGVMRIAMSEVIATDRDSDEAGGERSGESRSGSGAGEASDA